MYGYLVQDVLWYGLSSYRVPVSPVITALVGSLSPEVRLPSYNCILKGSDSPGDGECRIVLLVTALVFTSSAVVDVLFFHLFHLSSLFVVSSFLFPPSTFSSALCIEPLPRSGHCLYIRNHLYTALHRGSTSIISKGINHGLRIAAAPSFSLGTFL